MAVCSAVSSHSRATGRVTERRERSREHIPCLNGLRAVAVFLVIFHHYGLTWLPGAMGVTIFFVLSGFLITHLLIKENLRCGEVSLKNFYIRRMLRIFPALYIYLAATVFSLSIGHFPIDWRAITSSAVFTMDYYRAITHDDGARTWITWSLGVEEQFYLLWPPAFVLLRNDPRRLAKALSVAILGIWTIRIALTQMHMVSLGYVYNAFDMRCDALLVGCLLAVCVNSGFIRPVVTALKRNAGIGLISAFALAASAYLQMPDRLHFAYYQDVALAMEPLVIAVLILQVSTRWDYPLWRWLEWKPVNQLGIISYGLYLYHVLAAEGFSFVAPHASQVLKFCAALALTIFVSAISFYGIEARFLKLKPKPCSVAR